VRAAASAASPVVLAGTDIGGEHVMNRLRIGHKAVTARQPQSPHHPAQRDVPALD